MQVRHQLALQDAENDTETHVELSPSTLIAQGLELDELQYALFLANHLNNPKFGRCRLRLDIKNLGLHATELQRARIVERSAQLRRRIETWQMYQHVYMPAVALLRTTQCANQEDASHA